MGYNNKLLVIEAIVPPSHHMMHCYLNDSDSSGARTLEFSFYFSRGVETLIGAEVFLTNGRSGSYLHSNGSNFVYVSFG